MSFQKFLRSVDIRNPCCFQCSCKIAAKIYFFGDQCFQSYCILGNLLAAVSSILTQNNI